MEAREIRVGSKVNLNGADVTVKTIEYNPVSEEYFISVFEDARQIKVNYLSPIPITEELLLKAGFIETGYGWFDFNYFSDCNEAAETFTITINIKSFRCGVYNPDGESTPAMTKKVIQYIHQLQNLIYSLTGSELTFKQ